MTNWNSGDRYTIDEVAALYELEPDLVDIVVEGNSDASILRWYLKSHNAEAEVHPVDARYDVPEEYVRALGLSPSARNRAIALAVFLVEDHGFTKTNLTAFVDADYAHILGPIPRMNQHVVMTDFPAIECYALQDAPLEKFLRLAAYLPAKHSAGSVKASVMPALQELYAVRAMLAQHDVAIHSRFVNDCNFHPTNGGVDHATIIRKSMGSIMRKMGLTQQQCEIEAEMHARWFRAREYYCRGHDIAFILFKYLNLRAQFGSPESVERALVASLELADLDHHDAFTALRDRVSSAA